MCLILFAHNHHPKYKLIVAANRDEFFKRETEPAHFWKDNPNILAGRDLEAGGTWLGVNKAGEISMLTNYRDLKNIKPEAPSRGRLVSDFLLMESNANKYLSQVAENGNEYNGFNLICGDKESLYYYGNYQEGVHEIDAGIHGLSNALLDTPWPKVIKGKEKFASVVDKENFNTEDLLDTLYDDIKAPPSLLPDTGVGLEKESMLSPMFIKSAYYGSRCSTVLLIDHENKLTFIERTYNVEDYSYFDKCFEVIINQKY